MSGTFRGKFLVVLLSCFALLAVPLIAGAQTVDDLLPDDVLEEGLPPLPPPPGNPPSGDSDGTHEADGEAQPRPPFHAEAHRRAVGLRVFRDELRNSLLKEDLLEYSDALLRPQFTGVYEDGSPVRGVDLPGGVALMDQFRQHTLHAQAPGNPSRGTANPEGLAAPAGPPEAATAASGSDVRLEAVPAPDSSAVSHSGPPAKPISKSRALARPAPENQSGHVEKPQPIVPFRALVAGGLSLAAILILLFRRLAGFGAGRL